MKKLTEAEKFYIEHHATAEPKEIATTLDLDIRTVRAYLSRLNKQKSDSVETPEATPVVKQKTRLQKMMPRPGVIVMTAEEALEGDVDSGTHPEVKSNKQPRQFDITKRPGIHKIYEDQPCH